MEVSTTTPPRMTLEALLSRLLEMLGDKGLDELSAMEISDVKSLMTSYEVTEIF